MLTGQRKNKPALSGFGRAHADSQAGRSARRARSKPTHSIRDAVVHKEQTGQPLARSISSPKLKQHEGPPAAIMVRSRNKMSMVELGSHNRNMEVAPTIEGEQQKQRSNQFSPQALNFDPRQLVNWVKLEMQTVVEEFKLDAEYLQPVKQALTYRQLYAAVIGALTKHLRECTGLKQCRSLGSLGMTSPLQQKNELAFLRETNDVLKKSQTWAKQKLQEMKCNWKQACQKVLRLEKQLEQKDAQTFNLQRHDNHTKRLIEHLQQYIKKVLVDKEKLAEYHQANIMKSETIKKVEGENKKLRQQLMEQAKHLSRVECDLQRKSQQLSLLEGEMKKFTHLHRRIESRRKTNNHLMDEQPGVDSLEKRREARPIMTAQPILDEKRRIVNQAFQYDEQSLSPSQSAREVPISPTQFVKALRERIHHPPPSQQQQS